MKIELTDGTLDITFIHSGTDALVYDPAGLEWSMVDYLEDDAFEALMAKYPNGEEGTYWAEFFEGATEEYVAAKFEGVTTVEGACKILQEV